MDPEPSIGDGSPDGLETTLRPTRPVQEGIPAEPAQRERTLDAVRRHVTARTLVPPLSLEELQDHSARVLEIEGLGSEYRDWVAVLVSNEVWRETVAGIGYDRRLLLLPQCLRDRSRCRGELDEYGLVCARCGGCCIGEFQAEAERLGYAVMVAEGSPVVMSLIESGQVQAVIGVSCLAVLERVFPYMEAGAVPGMAIPLLQDGCADTSAQTDWVWDAIYMTRDDKTRCLDLEALRRQVQGWFTQAALADLLGPADSQTDRIARDWLVRAGKRWRPFLAACAFKALGPEPEAPIDGDFRTLGVAIECFHKASLVHDDIEDQDDRRYGRQALHEEYGVPVALNVGDYLLGLGYRLIARIDLPPGPTSRMLRVAADGHLSLCLGQGQELWWTRRPQPLSLADVLEIFRRKTAPSFEVALRLGAICAGQDHKVWSVLRQYSQALGVAYQIRDDIDDCFGTEDPGDAYAARPNVLLAIAHERAAGKDRDLLERVWQQSVDARAAGPKIRDLFARLQVARAARELLEAHKSRAIRCLTALDGANLKGLLRRVVAKIFNDVKVMGCCNDHQAANARRSRGGDETAG